MTDTSSRPRLTVAILTHNAHAILGPTLDCARSMADEILVVDAQSTDNSAQLASDAGAHVLTRAWDHDFSAARNFGLERATGEWVLWLDAGETLSPAGVENLREFIHRQADPGQVYSLLVTVPPAAGSIAAEQIRQIRLMPRRADLRYMGRVRENLETSAVASGLKTEPLSWTIHRPARDNEPNVKMAKARRDLALVDLEIKTHGQTPELLVTLGEALAQLGDEAGAAATFRMVLTHAEANSRTKRAAYYGLVSGVGEQAGSWQKPMTICSEALAQFPTDAQLLCALGGYLQAENRLDLAERAYRTALAHGEVDPYLWHVQNIDEIAGVCLALVYQLQDKDDTALEILQGILARHPNSTRVRRHLIDLHVKCDRRQDALAEFDKLPRDMPHREALRSAVRGACLAAKRNWIPALAYLQTAYNAGCRDVLCLRWLAVALISNNQIAAAAPVLHEWHAAEPRNVESRKYLDALAAGTLLSESLPANLQTEGRILRLDPATDPAGGHATTSTRSVPTEGVR